MLKISINDLFGKGGTADNINKFTSFLQSSNFPSLIPISTIPMNIQLTSPHIGILNQTICYKLRIMSRVKI